MTDVVALTEEPTARRQRHPVGGAGRGRRCGGEHRRVAGGDRSPQSRTSGGWATTCWAGPRCDELAEAGVLTCAPRSTGPRGPAPASSSSARDGARSMYPDAGANARLSVDDLPVDLLAGAAPLHLHVSGYALLSRGVAVGCARGHGRRPGGRALGVGRPGLGRPDRVGRHRPRCWAGWTAPTCCWRTTTRRACWPAPRTRWRPARGSPTASAPRSWSSSGPAVPPGSGPGPSRSGCRRGACRRRRHDRGRRRVRGRLPAALAGGCGARPDALAAGVPAGRPCRRQGRVPGRPDNDPHGSPHPSPAPSGRGLPRAASSTSTSPTRCRAPSWSTPTRSSTRARCRTPATGSSRCTAGSCTRWPRWACAPTARTSRARASSAR